MQRPQQRTREPVAAPSERRGWVTVAPALVFLVIISYYPVLSAGFVWDDHTYVTSTVVAEGPSGLAKIWLSPRDNEEKHYWPLTYTSFWLEHKLWGFDPFGYHLSNLLLYLLCTLLVWRLLVRLSVPGAALIAAVFAVHPLHVETVAWVIGRKDLLATALYLGAALLWLRFLRSPRPSRYLGSLALFVGALLSKSMAVTFPVAMLIERWWRAGRVRGFDLMRTAPFFGLGIAIGLAELAFYRDQSSTSLSYSLAERVLIASRALWHYAGKVLWPAELPVVYPLWDITSSDPVAWVYLLAALALALLLWRGRTHFRGALAGVAFFAVTLAPVLGFVDFTYMRWSLVADRYAFLASAGVLAVVVGGALQAGRRLPPLGRWAARGAFVALLALFGAWSFRHAEVFRDGVTLFSHVVSLNPEAWRAHGNLARNLHHLDRLEEADAAVRIALEGLPDDQGTLRLAGSILMDRQRFDEAGVYLRRAVEMKPRQKETLLTLAEFLRRTGHHGNALAGYRAILEVTPDDSEAHIGMARTLFDTGRFGECLEALDRVLAREPNGPRSAEAHGVAGRASYELGLRAAAVQHYDRAFELDARAVERLALEHFRDGRYGEAFAYYRAYLDRAPETAQIHSNLGASLFYLGRPDAAIQSLERALALDPDHPMARANLRRIRGALSR